MDMTTIRLAEEEMLPHELVVKKVKKYSGSSYGKNGKIYKMEKNRLTVLRMGRVEVDGMVQSVYKFDMLKYEACEKMEARFQQNQKDAQSKRAKEEGHFDKKPKVRKGK